MSKTFELKFLGPETEDALITLARLTKSQIDIQQVVTVTVASDELVTIVRRILGELVVDSLRPVTPASKAVATTKGSLDVRSCEQCGAEYAPTRVDQKYCLDPECKKARQKTWAAQRKQAEETKIANPVPLSAQ